MFVLKNLTGKMGMNTLNNRVYCQALCPVMGHAPTTSHDGIDEGLRGQSGYLVSLRNGKAKVS